MTDSFIPNRGLTPAGLAGFCRLIELADAERFVTAYVRAAEDAAYERAAAVLDAEVADHLATERDAHERHKQWVADTGGGERETDFDPADHFCEAYGCGSLTRFAQRIRALKATTEPPPP